jgi:hypothetical protein
MPERRGHAVSGGREGRRERPETWLGHPRLTNTEADTIIVPTRRVVLSLRPGIHKVSAWLRMPT